MTSLWNNQRKQLIICFHILIFCLVSSGIHAAEPGILVLSDDERLSGRLLKVDSEAGTLAWETDNGPSPLVFDLDAVVEVKGTNQLPAAKNNIQVVLDQGDVWTGKLISLDRETTVINSLSAGRIEIPTARMRELHVDEQTKPLDFTGPGRWWEWSKISGLRGSWRQMNDTLVVHGHGVIWKELPGLNEGGMRMAFDTSGVTHMSTMVEFYSDRATAKIHSPEMPPWVSPRVPRYERPGPDNRNTYALYINAQNVILVRFKNGKEKRLAFYTQPVQQRFDNSVEIYVDRQRSEILVVVDDVEAFRYRDQNGFAGAGDAVTFVTYDLPSRASQPLTAIRNITIERYRGVVPDIAARRNNLKADSIVFPDTTSQQGTIRSIADGTVTISIGQDEKIVPLNRIRSIMFAPTDAVKKRISDPTVTVDLNTRERVALNSIRITDDHITGQSQTVGKIRMARSTLLDIRFGAGLKESGPETLTLRDGGRLSGRLVSIHPEEKLLSWSSPGASSPLKLHLDKIKEIKTAAEPATITKGEFAILMVNGDRWTGKIVSWNPRHLVLDSASSGQITLPTDKLASLIRLNPLRLSKRLEWKHEMYPIRISRSVIAEGKTTPDGLLLSGNTLARAEFDLPEGTGLRVAFDAEWWDTYNVMKTTMFSDGNLDTAKGYILKISFQGITLARADAEEVANPRIVRPLGVEIVTRQRGVQLGSAAMMEDWEARRPRKLRFEVYVIPKTSEISIWIDGKEMIRARDPDGMAKLGKFLTFECSQFIPQVEITNLQVHPFAGPLPPTQPEEAKQTSKEIASAIFTDGEAAQGILTLRDEQGPRLQTRENEEIEISLDRVQSLRISSKQASTANLNNKAVIILLSDGSRIRLRDFKVINADMEGTNEYGKQVTIKRNYLKGLSTFVETPSSKENGSID